MDGNKTSGNQNRQQVMNNFTIAHQDLILPKFELLTKETQSIKLITLLQQPYYLLFVENTTYVQNKY